MFRHSRASRCYLSKSIVPAKTSPEMRTKLIGFRPSASDQRRIEDDMKHQRELVSKKKKLLLEEAQRCGSVLLDSNGRAIDPTRRQKMYAADLDDIISKTSSFAHVNLVGVVNKIYFRAKLMPTVDLYLHCEEKVYSGGLSDAALEELSTAPPQDSGSSPKTEWEKEFREERESFLINISGPIVSSMAREKVREGDLIAIQGQLKLIPSFNDVDANYTYNHRITVSEQFGTVRIVTKEAVTKSEREGLSMTAASSSSVSAKGETEGAQEEKKPQEGPASGSLTTSAHKDVEDDDEEEDNDDDGDVKKTTLLVGSDEEDEETRKAIERRIANEEKLAQLVMGGDLAA